MSLFLVYFIFFRALLCKERHSLQKFSFSSSITFKGTFSFCTNPSLKSSLYSLCFCDVIAKILGMQRSLVKIWAFKKQKSKIFENFVKFKKLQNNLRINLPKFDFKVKNIAFLGRPSAVHSTLDTKIFCYDVTKTSTLIRGLERQA